MPAGFKHAARHLFQAMVNAEKVLVERTLAQRRERYSLGVAINLSEAETCFLIAILALAAESGICNGRDGKQNFGYIW